MSTIALTGGYSAAVVPSARGMRPARLRGVTLRRRASVLVSAILVLLMLGTLSIGRAQSASANWFTDAIQNTFCTDNEYFSDPTGSVSGISAMIINSGSIAGQVGAAGSTIIGGDASYLDVQRTPYEKWGTGGTSWTVYRGGYSEKSVNEDSSRVPVDNADTDRRTSNIGCFPISQVASTYFANMIFGVTKFLTSVSTWLITQAYNPTWLQSINDSVATVIAGENGSGGLKDAVYFPFLSLVVMLGALYLGWVGLVKKRSMEAATSALWMFGCILVGSLLVVNPTLVPSMANLMTDSVAQAMIAGAGATTTGGEMCALDDLDSRDQATRAEATTRSIGCSLYVTFVYVPFVVGQYGTNPADLDAVLGTTSTDMQVSMGGGHTLSGIAASDVDSRVLDKTEIAKGQAGADESLVRWHEVTDAVLVTADQPQIADTWQGQSGMDRIQVASASLTAAGFGLAIVAVLSISILAYGLGASILSFFSVIFLLIGAHPGIGRRLALRWAEMYVGTLIKKVVLIALLSMTMLFYGVILARATTDWMGSVLAIAALSIAVLMYRKSLVGAVDTSVNFGGSGIDSSPTQQAGQRVTGMASGAVLGVASAVGGAGVAGKAAASAAGTSKVRKVATATRASGSVLAKGAGRGALRGAAGARSGIGSMYAMRDGARGAQADASRYTSRQREQERQAEQARRRQERRDDPREYAREQARAEQADRQYQRDWTANHQDAQWQDMFRRKYGFTAPDPRQYRFAGYGRSAQEVRDDPDLMPTPRGDEQAQPRKHEGSQQRQQAPRPEQSAGPTESGMPRPQQQGPKPQPGPKPANGGSGQHGMPPRPNRRPDAGGSRGGPIPRPKG